MTGRTSQHESYWGLDCSDSKITFHNFPSPVLQITVCPKDKGRGRDSTSECAQLKPVWPLVLCWGCGKGAKVVLLFHFKALEDLHYLHQGFCLLKTTSPLRYILSVSEVFDSWRSTSLTRVSSFLSSWLVMSQFSYCHSNADVLGHVAAVSTICHSSEAVSPK